MLTFRVARYPDETLGQRIKKLRLEMGMKQVELAKALGVNKDTISNWEKGRTVPSGDYLRLIEGYFGGKMEKFGSGLDRKPSKPPLSS